LDRLEEPATGPSGHSYTFLGFHRETGDPIRVVGIKPPPRLNDIDRIVFEVPPSDTPYDAHPRDVVATIDGKLWRDFTPPEPEPSPKVDPVKVAEFREKFDASGTTTCRCSSEEPPVSNTGKTGADNQPTDEVWNPDEGPGVPTYYVDTENGSDATGDGSYERPWQSLAFAKAWIRVEKGGDYKCIIREGCALLATLPDNPSFLKTESV